MTGQQLHLRILILQGTRDLLRESAREFRLLGKDAFARACEKQAKEIEELVGRIILDYDN